MAPQLPLDNDAAAVFIKHEYNRVDLLENKCAQHISCLTGTWARTAQPSS